MHDFNGNRTLLTKVAVFKELGAVTHLEDNIPEPGESSPNPKDRNHPAPTQPLAEVLFKP